MIWIVGNKGMLGQELCLELEQNRIPFIGTDRELSILEPEALSVFARENKPDWIVNCSAYTAVDKAEDDIDAAFAINRDGAGNVAVIASRLDIPLIHISTDYVFNGTSSTPLNEEASADPQSIYGKSKLEGEEKIRSICSKYFIIRTAWLYGQFGPNFVFTMLKLMNSRDEINVVNDQHGSPSWTRILTKLISTFIELNSTDYGLYHLSGEGRCTWYEFAKEIYRLGKSRGLVESECTVNPCSSDEFPAKAKRPEFSLLSKEKVKTVFGYEVPDWKKSLDIFMEIVKREGVEIK